MGMVLVAMGGGEQEGEEKELEEEKAVAMVEGLLLRCRGVSASCR